MSESKRGTPTSSAAELPSLKHDGNQVNLASVKLFVSGNLGARYLVINSQ